MPLNGLAFSYLKPTHEELEKMASMRAVFNNVALSIEHVVPDGPDRTYILRELRSIAMWVNVAITRHPDGSPRDSGAAPDYPPDHPAPGDLGSVPQ